MKQGVYLNMYRHLTSAAAPPCEVFGSEAAMKYKNSLNDMPYLLFKSAALKVIKDEMKSEVFTS